MSSTSSMINSRNYNMTLNELSKRMAAIGSQLNTADIPIVHNGKEVDLWLSLNDDMTVKLEKVVPGFKSPFSGGPVVEEWVTQNVTYRGTEVSIRQRQYRCVDTGNVFYTAEMEEDAIWEAIRKYWEKQGVSAFELIRTKK